MLREIQPVRQHPGEPARRWFNSADVDLILWLPTLTAPACEAVAFQLCYDKRRTEHALHWQAPGTCKHFQVEDGEQGNRSSSHKSAPLLQTTKPLNARRGATLTTPGCCATVFCSAESAGSKNA